MVQIHVLYLSPRSGSQTFSFLPLKFDQNTAGRIFRASDGQNRTKRGFVLILTIILFVENKKISKITTTKMFCRA